MGELGAFCIFYFRDLYLTPPLSVMMFSNFNAFKDIYTFRALLGISLATYFPKAHCIMYLHSCRQQPSMLCEIKKLVRVLMVLVFSLCQTCLNYPNIFILDNYRAPLIHVLILWYVLCSVNYCVIFISLSSSVIFSLL